MAGRGVREKQILRDRRGEGGDGKGVHLQVCDGRLVQNLLLTTSSQELARGRRHRGLQLNRLAVHPRHHLLLMWHLDHAASRALPISHARARTTFRLSEPIVSTTGIRCAATPDTLESVHLNDELP